MRASLLTKTLTAYRIGVENNWNTATCRMIYCSQYYSTALLEKLVRLSDEMPLNQQWIKITIPVGTTYEVVTSHSLPRWDEESTSKAFGDMWIKEKRSYILIVPSIIARQDNNILINEAHSQFPNIETSLNHPVVWDKRFFLQ